MHPVLRARYNAYLASYMRERYLRRRQELVEFLGGQCRFCGSVDHLEIAYVDRRFKRAAISKILASSPLWRVYQDVMLCDLLCQSCHAAQMSSQGHGLGATGKRNCYCDLCKPLKQRYNRNRKVRLAIQQALAEHED